MTANNSKDTTNSMDGVSKESLNNTNHVQPVSGALDATTGGQVKGSVTAQSGNRVQAANEEGAETV